MSIGLARVTISAPQRRIDVALPEHVPLVELLPEVLRHAGEGLADDGESHGGWLLRRTDGGVLAPEQALYPQGVRDGEILHLVPAQERWPELEYDDVVEAIAAGARRRGALWTGAATRSATSAGALVLLAVVFLAILSAGSAWGGAGFVALGVAALLSVAGVTAARAYVDGQAGRMLAASAMPYAFVGGAMVVSPRAGDQAGAMTMFPWLGGPELLVGGTLLGAAAMLGGAGVPSAVRIFTAGATVGALTAVTALVSMVSTPAGSAAVLISILVCGIGVLPLLALRFGRMPMPPVTLPAGSEQSPGGEAGQDLEAVRELPDREAVFAAVGRTDDILAGMLLGHAVLAAAAFLVLAESGSLSARILTAVAVVALLLRSRLFKTVRQRAPLIGGALAGVAAIGIDLLRDAGTPLVLGTIAAGVTLALAVVAAGATYAQRPPSPYVGRAADLLDSLAVISVIPVTCAVLGFYEVVNEITLG